MFQLIKKDILFNWKWALLLVVVAVFFPVVFCLDEFETRLTLWVYILGVMLANSHLVSKSCYLDDSMQTRRFLAALPVTKAQLIASKYALGLLSMVVSLSLTSLSALSLGLQPSIQSVQISAIYLLLYYAVFLGAYFRTNYSNAEKMHTALIMLTIMSLFSIDRSGIHLDRMVIDPIALLSGLGLCVLIFAASMFFSIFYSNRFLTGNE